MFTCFGMVFILFVCCVVVFCLILLIVSGILCMILEFLVVWVFSWFSCLLVGVSVLDLVFEDLGCTPSAVMFRLIV